MNRDPYGNISASSMIQVFFGGTTGTTSGEAPAETGGISYAAWFPSPTTTPLNRYDSYYGHWVTTGPPGSYSYSSSWYGFEATMGYLFMANGNGSPGNTIPLYSCQVSGTADQFVSLASDCESHVPLGIMGSLYTVYGFYPYTGTPVPSGTQSIYRCYTGVDHFVSTDPGCEGQTTEALLGYVQTSP